MLLRVYISGSAVEDINGKYDVCNEHSKIPLIGETKGTPKKPGKEIRPDFMYLHISNTTKHEYGLYLQSLPKLGYQESVWVITRLNHEKEPLIYYCCEQTKGNIPPESGWKAVGGHEPVPTVKFELLDNPAVKNNPPIEVSKHHLEQVFFGHANYNEGVNKIIGGESHGSSANFKNANVEYQAKALSKPKGKTILQQPPCSDMLRSVNEMK